MNRETKESLDVAHRLLKKYNLYSKDIKRLLIVSGIWPTLHPIVQRVVAYFALAAVAFTFMGVLNFSLHYTSNIMLFTQAFGLAVAMIAILLKICLFLLYRDDLANLNANLSAQFNDDLTNEIYVPLALSHYQAFANLAYALTTTVGIASSVPTVFIPLLALRHGKYVHGILVTYPFTYEPGSLIYWMMHVTFIFAAFFIWTVTCGVDSYFGQYTLQMCGEFRILAYKFENLNVQSVDYRRELKDCIQRHYLLLRSKETLEKIFSFPILWLAVTSAIIQCTMVFQLSELINTKNFSKIVYLTAHLSLKLVQAYMYAWYGNLISQESDDCLNAIYNCCWAGSGNTKFMKDVLIVISQRSLNLTAIGCLRVTMEMFAKIAQTSISYFFLLQTLKESQ